MFVALKTLCVSALKSRYKIGNEYTVKVSAFQNMLKVIFRYSAGLEEIALSSSYSEAG